MIVSITRIKLKNPLKLLKFFSVTPKIMRQAQSSPGNIHSKARYKGYLTFWTLTSWKDEKSLMGFVMSGIHKQVMKETRWYSDDFGTTHWITEDNSLPDWSEAERYLNQKERKKEKEIPLKHFLGTSER